MSRSGYSEDCENLELYRASVERAIYGKRGQAFLKELAAALDAMPEKVLIRGELVDEHGGVCAIGAVCKARNLDVINVNYDEPEQVAKLIGVARSMAAEIAYMNDERGRFSQLPSERWKMMREWVNENLVGKPNEQETK